MSAEQFDHAMGDADALMWNIERDPQLRSTIVAMLVLDSPPKWKRVLERLERGTQLIPRLRQRVIEPAVRLGPPMWSADPDFDLSYHARRVRLPKPRRHEDVLEIVGRAAMGDFDRARPLWECTLVEGLPDGRAAFVLKVHHSMTDGVGGMRLMLMLFDLERDALDDATEVDPMPLPMFSPLGMLSATLEWQARRAADGAQRGLDAARAVLQRLRDDAPGALDDAAKTINSVARFLAPAPAPMSPLLAERSLDRRVTTTRFPLDDLKAAANAVGGTVNDAFVAAVLGGLRRYHDRHDADVPSLRMLMPISVRSEGSSLGGNHFTPARVVVPLTIDDPTERIREVGERCRRLRAEPAVGMTESVAGLLNRMPRRLATLLFGSMLKGADFATSNVPGAPFPLYLCGSEVEEMYAFSPLSGTAANITLLTYRGDCCIGVNVDTHAIPDAKRFTRCLRKGLREVLALG